VQRLDRGSGGGGAAGRHLRDRQGGRRPSAGAGLPPTHRPSLIGRVTRRARCRARRHKGVRTYAGGMVGGGMVAGGTVRTRCYREGQLYREGFPIEDVSEYLRDPANTLWFDLCPVSEQALAMVRD